MSNTVIEFYKKILPLAAMRADASGAISYVSTGETMPATVNKKRLVLPTREQLGNPDWSNREAFHPLRENMLLGESPVLAQYRSDVNVLLNVRFGGLLQYLVRLCADTALHERIPMEHHDILSAGAKASQKTLDFVSQVLKAMDLKNATGRFINVYLTKSGRVRNKSYSRAAIVSFPVFEALEKKAETICGVKVPSQKERDTLASLMKFMLPNIDVAHSYDVGSDSDIAPFIDALLRAAGQIASYLNVIVKDYEQFIPEAEKYRYPDDWVETLDNLASIRHEILAIPMLPGNEGTSPRQAAAQAAAPVVQQPVAQPVVSPSAPMVAAQAAPVVSQGSPLPPGASQPVLPPSNAPAPNKVSYNEILKVNPMAGMLPAVGGVPAMPMVNVPPGYIPAQPGMMPMQPTMFPMVGQPGVMPQAVAQPQQPQIGQVLQTPQGLMQCVPDQFGRPVLVPYQGQPGYGVQQPQMGPELARQMLASQQFVRTTPPPQMLQPGMMQPGMVPQGYYPGGGITVQQLPTMYQPQMPGYYPAGQTIV